MFAAAIVPAAFYLDAAVETDREQVESSLHQFIGDYREKRAADVGDAISAQSLALKAAAMVAVNIYNFENDRVTDVSVTESADGYVSHFRLNADFIATNHGSIGRRPTRWNVQWVFENDRWKIRDVTRLNPVNGQELGSWDKIKP